MKNLCTITFATIILISCAAPSPDHAADSSPIAGAWKMVSGMQVQGSDTTLTDYSVGQEMIKMYTDNHFSFLRHDLRKGADSLELFVAGGGRYQLNGDKCIEYLDYCNFREWEGHHFELTYRLSGDTLITSSVERIEALGVDQLNIEKLVRIKASATKNSRP